MHRDNYVLLAKEYGDPRSLSYKKLIILDKFVEKGNKLLDIGIGVGEWIELEKYKFDLVYGIDNDANAIEICNRRFIRDKNIFIKQGSMENVNELVDEGPFDCITCLDVLEHVDLNKAKLSLDLIYDMLEEDGTFIFSGPGIFEKIKIFLGKSPSHIHSHSSYGWKKLIEESGFSVSMVETVEFPIFKSDLLRLKLHLFGKCCIIIAGK